MIALYQQVFSDSPFSVISPAGTLFAYLPWLALWNTNVLLSAGIALPFFLSFFPLPRVCVNRSRDSHMCEFQFIQA